MGLMAHNASANGGMQPMMSTSAVNGNGMTNGNVRVVDHDASRKKKRSKKKKDKSSKRKSKKDKKMSKRSSKKKKRSRKKDSHSSDYQMDAPDGDFMPSSHVKKIAK